MATADRVRSRTGVRSREKRQAKDWNGNLQNSGNTMSDDNDELDGKVDEKTVNANEIIKTMAKGTWGGKRPGTGGRRPGSGRKKGTPNFMTRELKEIARQEAP